MATVTLQPRTPVNMRRFYRNFFGRSGYDSSTKEAPLVLPAILNPFIEGAPAAVMTRIALDWIIDGTPLDELFEEVAEDQYTREFTLTHFVQVMLDVASGHRPSPRAAFLRRQLEPIASISAFYRKLNRMELAIPEAVVRRTAARARQLIVAGRGTAARADPRLRGPDPRRQRPDRDRASHHAVAHDLVGRPARACRWRSTNRPAD